ncbi:MAG: inorganic diphosphatase [Nanobdellota archaeon]
MEDLRGYIGRKVVVRIDRQLGSRHPEYDFEYPVNYGFVPGTMAGDGEEIDAYVLGTSSPVNLCIARCIAVIERKDDSEDKLVTSTDDKEYSEDEIRQFTDFQERFFDSDIYKR